MPTTSPPGALPTTSSKLPTASTPEQALTAGVDALLRRQNPQGWWKGNLESNVSIEAEDLLLRQFLGISDPEILATTANWIRSKQSPQGTWSAYYGGDSDLSITTEAYVALRLAGDTVQASHMAKAREFILDSGGLERTRVFTRIWMALFGEWQWEHLPVLLPEMMFLPKWFPLNIYDFACWARQTIVPLTVVGAYKPCRPLGFEISELRTGMTPKELEHISCFKTAGAFQQMDKLLHKLDARFLSGTDPDAVTETDTVPDAGPDAAPDIATASLRPNILRRIGRPIRDKALRKAERWILQRQEADGCWGGIQPPWVYSVLALHLRGYPDDHPVMARALSGFDEFQVREGDMRWLECCQSPVWDTALAVVALGDAGVPEEHPTMVSAGEWLLEKEVRQHGDWSVRVPELKPGGWSFEFHNVNYPDIDDTAEVALALTKVSSSPQIDEALQRGITWLEGMQCSDGGYGAFDVDNTQQLCNLLPFCDFGEVIDPPSADVTSHAIEMLYHLRQRGFQVNEPALDRAVRWLLAEQEEDGSWFGRWGANYIYGTGAAVPALTAGGLDPKGEQIQRAVEFLRECQNSDGGWGEDMRSYDSGVWRAKGHSTASQTAWALLALLAGQEMGEPTQRGVQWLADTQLPDGTWDEPWYTGTGFPGDFLINYNLYRDVFPVTALGRYVSALRAGPAQVNSAK